MDLLEDWEWCLYCVAYETGLFDSLKAVPMALDVWDQNFLEAIKIDPFDKYIPGKPKNEKNLYSSEMWINPYDDIHNIKA